MGTDILNRDGIMYVRTKDRQYLTRSDGFSVQVNAVQCQQSFEINTPLKGDDYESLIEVIKEFSESSEFAS